MLDLSLLPLLMAAKPLDVRRLREVLDPDAVVRAMQAAGARPRRKATWWLAAVEVAPSVDELIAPAALPDLPGMADDIAAMVIEVLDGPAAIIALRTIYARAVKGKRAKVPVVKPEAPRIAPGTIRAAVREAAMLRRRPVVVEASEGLLGDPEDETGDALPVPDPTPAGPGTGD